MSEKESPVLLIIGTRPEGIKMAPVYHALQRAGIPTVVCSTMQHNQLLIEVLELFDIIPDISLNIMRSGQDLFYLTQAVLQKRKKHFFRFIHHLSWFKVIQPLPWQPQWLLFI